MIVPGRKVCERLVFRVALAHDLQLNALGDETALFRPDPCGQLHAPSVPPAGDYVAEGSFLSR